MCSRALADPARTLTIQFIYSANTMSEVSQTSLHASTPGKEGCTSSASAPPLSAEKFRRDDEDGENSIFSSNAALPRTPVSASAALPATIDAVTTPLRAQVRRALGETERLRVEAEKLASKLLSRKEAHELVSPTLCSKSCFGRQTDASPAFFLRLRSCRIERG